MRYYDNTVIVFVFSEVQRKEGSLNPKPRPRTKSKTKSK